MLFKNEFGDIIEREGGVALKCLYRRGCDGLFLFLASQ